VRVDTRRVSTSFSVFCGQNGQIQVHCQIQAVYDPNMMPVQHVRKWFREISGCRLSVTDEQSSERPPTFYRQGFEKCIFRLDKCINREGDYVEK
jgi:hypothetical protein